MAEAKNPDLVELTIGGQVHAGWKAVSIETGLENLASAFRLDLAERWPDAPDRFDLKAGAEAKVSIGGATVITGFIDVLESALDGGNHSIGVSGRSKAADLIDCSAVAKPGRWVNRTLEAIASELAKPFGVTVTAEASTAPPFKAFAIQQGESVFECIERMCRQRGLLPVSDAQGNIRIISLKPAGAAVRLEQGKHILSVEATHNVAERFSDYILKGQAAGDDDAHGKTVSEPKAEAKDPGVGRYRPLIIVAEDQATVASLRKRANWEATVRAAKGQSAQVSVIGWRSPDGKLWREGQKVTLDAPAAWMVGDLLVAAVTLTLDDDGGTVAVLTVVRPEAYSQEPVAETAKPSEIRKEKRK